MSDKPNFQKISSEQNCKTFQKIFNLNEEEARTYVFLFDRADQTIKNSLHYLAKMDDDLKLIANYSLEYITIFKKSIFDEANKKAEK